MDSFQNNKLPEIFSKALRAGRRTYFFDVRETKAGDYYLTITESKKSFSESGEPSYRKHKIYLYKEDFKAFTDNLVEATDFIYNEKGDEVISEIHQKDYHAKDHSENTEATEKTNEDRSETKTNSPETKADDSVTDFTDLDFEDI